MEKFDGETNTLWMRLEADEAYKSDFFCTKTPSSKAQRLP
jgi:hypothetical protein